MDDTADIIDAEVVGESPPPEAPEPGTDLELVETSADVDVPPEETVYAWAADLETEVQAPAWEPQTTSDAAPAARGGGGGASAGKGRRRGGGGSGRGVHFSLIDLSGMFSGLLSGWLAPRASVSIGSGNKVTGVHAPSSSSTRIMSGRGRPKHFGGNRW